MWLRPNKLSLNVEKTKLLVFWRQNTKLNNSFKIKLDGKRLFPTSSVKYLGILLDENLTWSPQISNVQMKLNWAIGKLSKLRYQANIYIPRMVHHSLFGPHLLYACQFSNQNNNEMQNRSLKKYHLKTNMKVQILSTKISK